MECGKCFKCREGTGCIKAISFAPSAMPNRHPGAVATVAKDRQWEADMPAYKRLRNNGVQPPRIDDSAALEAHASDQFEIEMGRLVPKEMKAQVREGLAVARELEISRPAGVQVPDAV